MAPRAILTRLLQLALVAAVSAGLFIFAGWLAVRFAVSGDTDRVPDLHGMTVDEATSALAALGMQVAVDEERLPIEDMAANQVVRHIPGPGTPVKRMRVVRLLLASGPRERQMPTMVGEPRPRAVIALEQQGFELEYVAVAPSTEVPRDTVIAQEPSPAELEPGQIVPLRLLTSLGPPTRYYVMADLVGQPAAEVRGRLEALGFRVSEGPNRQVISNVPAGTIVNHRPFPGFRIAAGGEIVLQVSR